MTAETHPIEKEQVMAYLDGELSPEVSARVLAHLDECSECRVLEAELRGVSSEMLVWTIDPSFDRLIQGVNAAVENKPTDAPLRIRGQFQVLLKSCHSLLLNRWTWAAAASLAAAVVVFMIYARPEIDLLTVNKSASTAAIARSINEPQLLAGRGGANASTKATMLLAPGVYQAKGEGETPPALGPMIARTASLNISVKDFGAARVAMDRIVEIHHGYAASLTSSSQKNEPQSLEASLQIPSAECDATLAALKALGHVQKEEQGGEEVTAQVVDLDARLKNARISETRLEEILRTRTGKVSDVLEVEKEISDVRESIEQMEAQQKGLHKRISFAAIQLSLHEEYEASLDVAPSSVGRRIRNAFVDGFHAAADGLVEFCVFLLHVAPSLILAAIILFWPARFAWRRLHKT